MIEACTPTTKTLRPCVEESVNWEHTENLYLKGDNLDALKLLQESYLGSINVIYIDPPYNTGKDFVYKDNYQIKSEDYSSVIGEKDDLNLRYFINTESNGRFHSDWCSMIYPRLKLARNLLASDGVIFISIDDRELSNLLKICDELFGSSNYLGCITWVKKTKPVNSGAAKYQLQSRLEYVAVYCKGKNSENTYKFKLKSTGKRTYDVKTDMGYCRLKDIEDSDYGSKSRDTMKFPILGITPSPGSRWKIGYDEIQRLISSDRVCVVDGKVKIRVYPGDEDGEIFAPFWSNFDTNIGTAESGKKELNATIGRNIGFDTVKPTGLIREILSHFDSDITVMDFFSGSGTVADAVMRQNANDGGVRKYIVIQCEEPFEETSDGYAAGFRTICDLGLTRIGNAGKNICKGDVGFRVFKVDESNVKENVYFSAKEYSQRVLSEAIDNIKEDRTGLDLLYNVMLDWGLKISVSERTEVISGKHVHIVDGGALIACFESDVDLNVIKSIAKMKPTYAVFRDGSFRDSSNKINLEEIFKVQSPDTVIKVI